MEQKYKYQYTHYILPFEYNEDYKEFLEILMNNNHISVTNFDKVRDLEIYSFFTKEILDLFTNEEMNIINKKDKSVLNILSQKYVSIFDYDISKDIDKKNIINDISVDIEKEDNEKQNSNKEKIEFDIYEAKIVVFNTNIAFLVLKTVLLNTNSINDVLDFNYRFKWLVSEHNVISKLENISISMIKDGKEQLPNIIRNIRNLVDRNKHNKLYTDSFYTFAYLCVDNIVWNETTKRRELDKLLYKYMKVFKSSYDTEVNIESTEIARVMEELKYSRIGLTKISSTMMCSGVDPYNFTILPREYETKMLYTYLISLYQQMFLRKANNMLASKNDKIVEKIDKQFIEFNKYIWHKEITISEKGTTYYNNLQEVLNLSELYKEVAIKHRLISRLEQVQKEEGKIKFLKAILGISIIINILLLLGISIILKATKYNILEEMLQII